MYHQAMDECQRLQSENVALRQMLQNALESGPGRSARSSSRGRNQTSRGTDSVVFVLKPHMSFVAEREIANHGRSCSPTLSRYCQPDPFHENIGSLTIAYLHDHSSACRYMLGSYDDSYAPDDAAIGCLSNLCKHIVYLYILQSSFRTALALPLCSPAWHLYGRHPEA